MAASTDQRQYWKIQDSNGDANIHFDFKFHNIPPCNFVQTHEYVTKLKQTIIVLHFFAGEIQTFSKRGDSNIFKLDTW